MIKGLIYTQTKLTQDEATKIKASMQSGVMREVFVEALDIGS
jgi:hypothetical protein